ncbi:hypothetical protein CVS40_11606 [Lucilia cuprina]|nr:hypothetical protein CVS40_11606 [Lucilia cuprina]
MHDLLSGVITENVCDLPNQPPHGSSFSETISIPDMSSEIENVSSSLKTKLKKWFIKYGPSIKCTNSLLEILKSENLDVPKSVGGLIGNKIKCEERTVSPGKYVHVGLQRQLEKCSKIIKNSDLKEIVIDIGIDGLPLYKSSSMSLWPILGRAVNIKNTDVFIIGCYVGNKKPLNIDSYLHDFVKEFSDLSQTGFIVDNNQIVVKIKAFVCDAPAEAFVYGIKEHMALNGCSKCQQQGKKIDNVLTYSITEGGKKNRP